MIYRLHTQNKKFLLSVFIPHVGQGRLDGAFCDYTENDKMEYLGKLRDFGVINIEMECTTFAALTYHAGIRSAIVCVALLDRLKGCDQVCAKSKKVLYQKILIIRFLKIVFNFF